MPAATTATNVPMSAGRSTFLRMIISGSESASTDIMKERTAPSAAPLPRSAWTMGMIPAAFEYIGTPSSTATGTAHQASRPMNDAMTVSYTHLRAHETRHDLVCRLLLEKKK